MAATLQLSADAQNVIAYFRALPQVVRQEVATGLRRSLLVMVGKVLQNTGLKWRRGAAGLAGRLTSYCRLGGPLGIDAAIGFRKTRGFPYEMAQEYGARARGGGAMAIPVTEEAKAHSERGGGPRDFGITLGVIKTAGGAVLAETSAKKFIVHYVLKKSIPPRLRFRETVAANVEIINRGIMDGARVGLSKARQAGA